MMTLARMDGLSNLAERPPRSPQLAQEADQRVGRPDAGEREGADRRFSLSVRFVG
jgi:hypothetical protein